MNSDQLAAAAAAASRTGDIAVGFAGLTRGAAYDANDLIVIADQIAGLTWDAGTRDLVIAAAAAARAASTRAFDAARALDTARAAAARAAALSAALSAITRSAAACDAVVADLDATTVDALTRAAGLDATADAN